MNNWNDRYQCKLRFSSIGSRVLTQSFLRGLWPRRSFTLDAQVCVDFPDRGLIFVRFQVNSALTSKWRWRWASCTCTRLGRSFRTKDWQCCAASYRWSCSFWSSWSRPRRPRTCCGRARGRKRNTRWCCCADTSTTSPANWKNCNNNWKRNRTAAATSRI